MAKDEKGFFDSLVEDFCNSIEIRGAIEATRDENGKADKWAATGLAMGLGHTSDDEMATLAAFLDTEGAFDDDTCNDNYLPPVRFMATKHRNLSDIDYGTGEKSEEFEDTFIGGNYVWADDMKLLSEAGYDEFELNLMEPEELKEAMENAGVDTDLYTFD